MKQLRLPLKSWGGKRRGAGRPTAGARAGVSHLRRPDVAHRHPVHVTLRLREGLGYLRGWRRRQAIEDALREAKARFGLRIVHYSIQGMHLHLLVEVDDRKALTRGIQGLSIRIALR